MTIPDAVGILDTSTGALVDALSYGGAVRAGMVAGGGSLSFVEGTATTATDSGDGSMIRSPAGIDSDNAACEWAFTSTPTPGAANVVAP